jgi:hypothetical protein
LPHRRLRAKGQAGDVAAHKAQIALLAPGEGAEHVRGQVDTDHLAAGGDQGQRNSSRAHARLQHAGAGTEAFGQGRTDARRHLGRMTAQGVVLQGDAVVEAVVELFR